MSIEVLHVTAGYTEENPILHHVNLKAEKGKVTVLVGPNGSGKSTLLKTIFGFLKPTKGRILHNEQDITGLDPAKMLSRGITYVMQGFNVFTSLRVHENLEMGGWILRRKGKQLKEAISTTYSRYPLLETRKESRAGVLSGGQQKTLEIGRGLMLTPPTILLDEPTAGLAPIPSEEVYNEIEKLKAQGYTILMVDQNVKKAISIADHVYVLALGKNAHDGPGTEYYANIENVVREWLYA